MSKVIKILTDLTINKIAAGEVVEGPYSVVKELIENSIDANATRIVVEIKEGGQKYIRVSDNGVGIYEEDVEIAFLRHTTSKIKDLEDLNNVLTLGFRGEALASIAAVSQTQIITKPKEQLYGIVLDIEGGNILNKQRIGTSDGTTIIVKNLFFNVPARLKFMKSPQGESTKVAEIVSRLALSQPHIAFKYINNNNIMFTTPGKGNLEQTIFSIFDKDLAKSFIPVEFATEEIKIHGFISQPTSVRGNRNFEIFFVNGRYVKSKLFSKAIEDAYKEKLPINKFPICILNIDINPNLIDINVHPTKTEIKIYQEDVLYKVIYDTIVSTLRKNIIVPSLVIKDNRVNKETWLNKTCYHENFKENKSLYNTHNKNVSNSLQICMKEHKDKKIDFLYESDKNFISNSITENEKLQFIKKTEENVEITQENFLINLLQGYKIIGQLFNTYIIIEKDFSMFLIDQHAAHERLVYNKMLHQYKNNTIIRQRLLKPEVLELSNEDYSFLMQHLERFNSLGFEIESFGINTIIIREVPLIMGVPTNYDFLFEIIDELKDGNYRETYFTEIIIRKSCREAIKASDKLTLSEINSLIKDLCDINPPLTCPHGRPIILSLTKYEIEKNFKRIQ